MGDRDYHITLSHYQSFTFLQWILGIRGDLKVRKNKSRVAKSHCPILSQTREESTEYWGLVQSPDLQRRLTTPRRLTHCFRTQPLRQPRSKYLEGAESSSESPATRSHVLAQLYKILCKQQAQFCKELLELLLGFLQLNALAFELRWHSIWSVRLFRSVLLRMKKFCSIWFFLKARRSSCADRWNTLKSGCALDSLSTNSVWSLLLTQLYELFCWQV